MASGRDQGPGLPFTIDFLTYPTPFSADAAAENYPFCTIEPEEARCAVPDARYKHLCEVWKPPSEYPAFLHLVDIAGLIKGASEGAGLGNAFLSHIQAVDGLFHVVRAFVNDEVTHVDDSVDPVRDLETITEELCKKDLAYVAQQRALRENDVRKNPTMKLPPLFFTVMDRVKDLLENNKPLNKQEWTNPEIEKVRAQLREKRVCPYERSLARLRSCERIFAE